MLRHFISHGSQAINSDMIRKDPLTQIPLSHLGWQATCMLDLRQIHGCCHVDRGLQTHFITAAFAQKLLVNFTTYYKGTANNTLN